MKIKFKSYGKTVERKLLPCPNPSCCSTGFNIELITGTNLGGKSQFDRVHCKTCGVMGPWYDGHPDDAVNGWNDLPRVVTTIQKSSSTRSENFEETLSRRCSRMKFIEIESTELIFPQNDFKPKRKIVVLVDLEDVQDSLALLGEYKTALKIGKKLLNAHSKAQS